VNAKRIVSGVVLFILVTALSGCQWGGLMGYQESEPGQQFVGHSAQELIHAWGPPARMMSDGGSGQVIVYTTVSQTHTLGTIVIDRVFYADAAGTITSWRRSMR
jgi:hypothetical protein